MKSLIPFLFIASVCLSCGKRSENAESNHVSEVPAHWEYKSDSVDLYWSSLSSAYKPCKDGRHQSPVNLALALPGTHDLIFNYSESHESIENNGHTVKLKYDSGSYLTLDNRKYELLQFHFHTPSEHFVEGNQYPLEAHLVHASADTVFLVYSVMFQLGERSFFIDSFLDDVPMKESKKESNKPIDIQELVASSRDHLMYEGSFTTPPCTEGVKWVVSEEIRTISKEQLSSIRKAEGENARPSHELFDREVERF